MAAAAVVLSALDNEAEKFAHALTASIFARGSTSIPAWSVALTGGVTAVGAMECLRQLRVKDTSWTGRTVSAVGFDGRPFQSFIVSRLPAPIVFACTRCTLPMPA